MPNVRVDTAPLIANTCVVSAFSGHGVRGADVPITGLHGPAILYPGLSLPAEANDEFRALILTRPPALTLLNIGEDSGLEAEGPDGEHVGTWRGYRNGVPYGPDPSTYTIRIGGLGLSGTVVADDAVASGVLSPASAPVLTGTVTTDAAVASGQLVGAPGPTPFQPVRAMTLMYSVLDPSATPDLTVKAPAEVQELKADFRPFATVTSPVWAIARVGGSDGTPDVALQGGSTTEGNVVRQRVQGGTSGNTYIVTCTANGPNGEVLVASGHLPVRAPN
jgi:hypothetical protein